MYPITEITISLPYYSLTHDTYFEAFDEYYNKVYGLEWDLINVQVLKYEYDNKDYIFWARYKGK